MIPTNNKQHIKTVKLIFELFTIAGLSRRQISTQLNAAGHKYYDQPFTHNLIGLILTNAAYVGDTEFGKTQTGDFKTFDKEGDIVTVKRKIKNPVRKADERTVVKNTHEGLISRKTWDLAVARMASEKERTSFSPRNPQYYLKQIFVCGHCGKNMTGRTDTDYRTKAKTVHYVCSSYLRGKESGIETSCGYHRINHDVAEKMLLDKIAQLSLEFDESSSEQIRANVENQIARLDHNEFEALDQMNEWVEQGVESLLAYMKQSFKLNAAKLEAVEKAARRHYKGRAEPVSRGKAKSELPISLAELKATIKEAEAAEVESATTRIAELKEDLGRYTRNWNKADDAMQAILKEDIDQIQAQMKEWEQRTIPLAQRLAKLSDEDEQRHEDRAKLVKEWPNLDAREKGEALRRLFKTVTLFWDREFKERSNRPTRELKTDRPGRYSYTLQTSKIVWELGTLHLKGAR